MSNEKTFLIMLIMLILITMGGAWASDDHAVDEIATADGEIIAADSVDDAQQYTSTIKENFTSQKNDEAVQAADSASNQKGEILSASNEEDVLGATPGSTITSNTNLDGSVIYTTYSTSSSGAGTVVTGSNFYIDGHGCSIDGQNKRIFTIGSLVKSNNKDVLTTATNIVIKNINFINGKSSIYIYQGCSVTFQNCNFTDCFSDSAGGAIYAGDANSINATLVIRDCNFNNVYASGTKAGGAIRTYNCDVDIVNSHFNDIYATDYGGAIAADTANHFNIKGSTFYNCRSNRIGSGSTGVLYIIRINGNISIVDSNFTSNYNKNGVAGAISVLASPNSDVTINNVIFKDNNATTNGGAFFINSAKTLTFVNSRFIKNNAGGNGIIYKQGTAVQSIYIENCSFDENNVSSGGAIYFSTSTPSVIIKNSTFTRNNASVGNGGAIYLPTGSNNVNITKCNFIGNNATSGYGGAIYAEHDCDNIVISNSQFINNTATSGGAIQLYADNNQGFSNLDITYSNFTGNHVIATDSYGGGAITLNRVSDTNISYCRFDKNIADNNGGAVLLDRCSNVLIDDDYFINNEAGYSAGALYVRNGASSDTVTISNSHFTSNIAKGSDSSYAGGAIRWIGDGDGTANIKSSTFTNNSAYRAGAFSMNAVYNLNIDDCTFEDNNATDSRGALWISITSKTMSITKSKFNRNTAKGQYGVLYFEVGNPSTIDACSFTNNSANDVSVLHIKNVAVTNSNFTLNKAINGNGAIELSDSSSVSNCNFRNNTAVTGGAIYSTGSSNTITKSNFTYNNATEGGAIYFNSYNGEISYCNFNNNTATKGGAIVLAKGNQKILNSNFTGNDATEGGAIYVLREISGVKVEDSSFTKNYANANGGAVYCNAETGTNPVTMKNDNFINNTAVYNGGAVYYKIGSTSYRDYNLFNHEGTNNSGTVTWTHAGAQVITTSLFEGNIDYYMNLTASVEGYTVTLTVTVPSRVNKQQTTIVVSLDNGTEVVTKTYNGNSFDSEHWTVGENYTVIQIVLTEQPISKYNATVKFNDDKHEVKEQTVNYTVVRTEVGDFTFIQEKINEAIRNAAPGEIPTITLNRTYTYNEELDKGQINITGSIIINGINNAEINALGYCRIFDVTAANVTINNILFRGGNASGNKSSTANDKLHGGAILWRGSDGTLANSTFRQNSAYDGGAVFVQGHNLDKIVNCEFSNNTAQHNGGAVDWNSSNGNLTDSRLFNNKAMYGGAVFVGANGENSHIYNCNFTNNNATERGGAVDWYASSGDIIKSKFERNRADYGGAVFVGTASEDGKIFDSTFISNTAVHNGGAVDWNASKGNVNKSYFYNNVAGQNGGAIFVGSSGDAGHIINSVFEGNNATNGRGGAVDWYASAGEITYSNFTNNHADYGGAVFVGHATEGGNITNSRFISNTADVKGGAVDWNATSGSLRNSYFEKNSADYGGALFVGSHSTSGSAFNNTYIANRATVNGGAIDLNTTGGFINGSRFYNNTAANGGAIFVGSNTTSGHIVNATFEGNNATYRGGAVDWYASAGEIYSSNFNNNRAAYGGAVFVGSATTGGNITLSNFTNNIATVNGGAVDWNASNGKVEDSRFEKNSAANGGAIFVGAEADGGHIKNATFTSNNATLGGAVYLNSVSNVDVSNASFTLNTADYAAAIYVARSTGTIKNSTFDQNDAKSHASDIYVGADSDISLYDLEITNTKESASSIYADSKVTINKTTISNWKSDKAIVFNNGESKVIDTVLDGENAILINRDATVNLTRVNNTGAKDGDYSVSNNGTLYLYSNNFTSVIINHHKIMTKTTTKVLDGGVLEIEIGESALLNASIVDDNNNIIIVPALTFVDNTTFTNTSTDDKKTHFGTYYKPAQGVYVITAENLGLEDNTLETGILKVKDPNTTLTLNVTQEKQGETVTIKAKINFEGMDAKGNVTFYINGVKQYVNNFTRDVDGSFIATLTLNNLNPDTYFVTAVYNGDDTHMSGQNDTYFVVDKRDVNITVDVVNIVNGQNATAVINTTANNGTVTILVNGREEKVVEVVKGLNTVDLGKLTPGNYTVSVLYAENTYYKAAHNDTTFEVYEYDMDVSISETQYNQSATITVTLPSDADGEVEIYLNGEKLENVEGPVNGVYTAVTPALTKVGNYTVNVTYKGNSKYYAREVNGTNFTVTADKDYKFNVTITPENPKYGENVTINVTGPAGQNVTVTIDGANQTVTLDENGTAVITINNLTAGPHSITANVTGNENYTSKEITKTLIVDPAVPEMTINVTQPIAPGSSANATVTVGDNATGVVVFYIDGKIVDSVEVKDGAAVLDLDTTVPGNYTVTAKYYSDDNNYVNAANLTGANYTVEKYDIAMNYTMDIKDDNNVTVVVKLNDTAEGTVSILFNGVNHTATVENGIARVNLGVIDEQKEYNNLAAVYTSSDSKFKDGSLPVNFTVSKLNNLTIEVTVNEPEFGDNATVIVKLPSDATTGTLNVTVGGVEVTAEYDSALGVYVATVPGLDVGTYDVNVTYTGDSKYADGKANDTLTVKTNSSYEFNVDVTPGKYGENTIINITGPAGVNVTVSIDGVEQNVTLDENGTYVITVNDLGAGPHNVTATIPDSVNYTSKSVTEKFTIDKQVPSMEIIVPTEHIAAGSTANIVVKVGDNATGNVTVYIDNVRYEVPVVDGEAVLPINTTKAGTFSVTAQYLGDENYTSGANNTAQKYTVNKYDITMTYTNVTVAPDNTVTFEVTLNETDAEGEVVITVGDKNYTAAVENGVAKVVVGPLAQSATEYKFAAVYSGDEKYNSTKVDVNVTVGKLRNGTMDISIIPNPGQYGQSVNITVTVPDATDGNVTVEVNGTPYTAREVAPGVYEVIVPELPVGDYPINVTYGNGTRYDEFKNSTTMSIGKNSTYEFGIVIEPKDNVKYGDEVRVNVTGLPGSEVEIIVDGVVYDTVTIGDDGKASKVYNNLTAATHTIVANYSGNESYEGAVAQDTITIVADDPEMIIEIVPGENVAPASDANITVFIGKNATGTAIIYIDGVPNEVPVINGFATLPINTTVPGTHNVTAKYLGDDGNYVAGVNNTGILYTIEKYDVSMENLDAVVAPNNEVTFTVKLNVTDAKGDIVYIEYDGKNYTGVVDENGVAQVTVGPMAASDAEYKLNAVYNGSSKYATANVTVNATVGKLRNGTMDISIVPNPGQYGQSVNITVTVPDATDGNVTVNVNGTDYPAVPVAPGVYEVIVPELPVGDYPINVTYGNGSRYDEFKNSTTLSIGKNSTYDFGIVIEPKDNVKYGDEVRVNVTGLPGSEVEIIVDGVVYDTVTIGDDGKASRVYNNLTAATHTIVANYSGNESYEGAVAQDTITIGADDPEMIIEIVPGENVAPTSDANITVFIGKNATGTVIVYIDGTPNNVPVVDGFATLPINTTVPGTHNVTAMYLGDDGNYVAGVNNTGILYTIEKYDVSMENLGAVVAPNNEVTFTVKLNVTDAKGDIVYIEYDGKNYTGVVDENGVAQVTVGPMAASDAEYNLNAVYNGSSKYATANVTVNTTVGKLRNGTMTVDLIPNPSQFGDSVNVTVTIPDVTDGNVTVKIGEDSYNAERQPDGTYVAIVPALPVGDHSINVTYTDGSRYDNFYDDSQSIHTDANGSYFFDVDVAPAKYGNDTVITVTAPTGVGQVNVTVDDEVYVVDIDPATGKGTLTLNNISAGLHNVTASFDGNKNYTGRELTETFTVPKQDSVVDVTVPGGEIPVNAKENITVFVGNNATGDAIVYVDNVPITVKVENGIATVPIDTTKPGVHNVTAKYFGDDNYTAGQTSAVTQYTVGKYDTTMEIVEVTRDDDNNVTVKVKVNGTEGNVTIKIGDKTYNATVGEDGIAEVNIGNAPVGSTDINVTYSGDDNFAQISAIETINVPVVKTYDMPVTSEDIGYGKDAKVNITLPDGAELDNLTVYLNDVEYDITGKYEQIGNTIVVTIPDLKAGEYTVRAAYADDGVYGDSENSTTFTVEKVEPVNPEIIINQPIDVGEDLNITVKLPEDATGEIIVVVNGTKYVFDLVNGSVNISIPNLGNGTYDVNVTYGGDDNYDPISENDTVVVSKVDPVMDAATGEIILGENAVINVTMPSDVTGTVTIKIEGVDEPITAPVSGGQNSIIVPGVPVGTHSVEITYNGDGKYENKTIATTLTVNPKPTSADDFKVEDKGNGTIIVTAPEGATGQVNLTIGNETYTVNITDGKAVFDIANDTNQTPGKHNITLNYSGDKNNKPVEFNETANVPQWSSTVSVDIPTIREGDIAKVNVTVTSTDDRGYVPTGNVRVVVDGKGYSGVLKDGSVIIEVPGLAEGPHDVEVYYDGDKYYLANETKGNVKVERKITAEVVGTGNSSKVVVELPEGHSDNVTVLIDGVEYEHTTDADGNVSVNLTGVLPGKHNLTVKYVDENGTESVITKEIIVPPWDSSVEASAKTIREGDVAKVVVTVGSKDMNGTVTVKVNGAGYTVDITDGTAIVEIPGLTNNTYDAVVIYNGNEKYLPSNNTFQIAVEAPLVINVNGTGNSSQVVIDLPGNGTVEAFIDGNRVDPIIENGTAKVNLTGLEPGKHNITVRYTDEDGTVSEVTQEIIVPPWDSSVEASAKTIREGDVANIVVKVGDENMTGEVKVDINGTGYYAPIVNGEVTIKAPGIKAGTYVGNVTYGGNEKYLASNNTFTLVVEEPIVIDINGTGNSSQVVIDLPANGTNNVTVTIDGNPVDVDVNNRTAVANLTGLEPGDHNITVVYTDADGTQSVVTQQITVPRWSSAVNATAATIREGDDAVIKVKVDSNETGTVYVDIAGTGYYGTLENGEVTIIAPGIKKGKYTGNVTYLGDEKYDPSNNTFTLEVQSEITIELEGAGNSSKVVVQLPEDSEGSNVTVMVDGKEVPVTVDENGTATADLGGLPVGEHNVTVIYKDKNNNTSIASKTVKIYKSINVADEIKRGWNSPYDAEAEFLDKDGHVLANTTVEFTVNGQTYKVVTDEKGIGKLTDSHLAVGKYEATIKNPVTGETVARNVTIVKRIIENKDLTTDYLAGKYYSVKVIGDDGEPVDANEVVGLSVNGVGYVIKSDKNGVAKLKINLVPKKYTIIAEYAKYKVTNKVVVKQTLKLVKKTVKVKKGKKIVIKAKLKWTNGKAIKGKKITIKFKGKKFSAKTNSKGIAKITIKKKSVLKKLKKGKTYKFTAFYVKEKAKGKIKIK